MRDSLDGEKVLQGFLAACLGVARHFVLRTEPELNKGFAALCLEPLVAQYPDLRHGYLIEIEYLKRSAAAGERDIRAAVRTATGQLQRYCSGRTLGASVSVGPVSGSRDRVPRLGDGVLRRDTAVTAVTLSSVIWMTVRTPPA